MIEKWLIVPDCHFPYVDIKAFDLMLRAAKSAKVDNVAVLGDFIDNYAVSSHRKSPKRRGDLAFEVDSAKQGRLKLDRAFKGKKKFIEGNHEVRLENYLTEKAPALFDTVNIQKLLELKENGWDWTPYKSYTKIGKLYLTHDADKAGKTAHLDALNAFQGNVVIGHTHRIGYAVEGNAKGKPHVGAMLGWLGDVEFIDYRSKIKAYRDWALGFGVAYKEPSGNVHVTPIPIVNGCVVMEGKLIR